MKSPGFSGAMLRPCWSMEILITEQHGSGLLDTVLYFLQVNS